jgi:protein-L-isoaspartate(D-aspartate) O-methyltransferase
MIQPPLPPEPPEVTALRFALVDQLKQSGAIRSAAVEAAFRAVPRHHFLPTIAVELAYQDTHSVTLQRDGTDLSSVSQPTIVALMLEQLAVQPGQHILEIGAGMGYNAALLAHLVGSTGFVVTLDLEPELTRQAHLLLRMLDLHQVQVICADGSRGYAANAPYDRIILTTSAGDIAPTWLSQLHRTGRLVVPLTLRNYTFSVAFDRHEQGLVSHSLIPCEFLPLRGEYRHTRWQGTITTESEPLIEVQLQDPASIRPDDVLARLRGSAQSHQTQLHVTSREMLHFWQWLALHELHWCLIQAKGDASMQGVVPYLFGHAGEFVLSFGLIDGSDLCLLSRSPDPSRPTDATQDLDEPAFPLWTQLYGDTKRLQATLVDWLNRWDAAKRPNWDSWRIRVYPREMDYQPTRGATVIDKTWMRMVIDDVSSEG